MSTTETTIKEAMSVARDVAEGRLDPDELGRAAADECCELFGTVAGPEDALWPLHVDIARQVLALGGVGADELSEWLAVASLRAGDQAISRTLTNELPEPFSSAASRSAPIPATLSLSPARR